MARTLAAFPARARLLTVELAWACLAARLQVPPPRPLTGFATHRRPLPLRLRLRLRRRRPLHPSLF